MTRALEAHRPELGDATYEGPYLLTYKQVARILQVHPRDVYELPMAKVRLRKNTIRWRSDVVRAFIERRTD